MECSNNNNNIPSFNIRLDSNGIAVFEQRIEKSGLVNQVMTQIEKCNSGEFVQMVGVISQLAWGKLKLDSTLETLEKISCFDAERIARITWSFLTSKASNEALLQTQLKTTLTKIANKNLDQYKINDLVRIARAFDDIADAFDKVRDPVFFNKLKEGIFNSLTKQGFPNPVNLAWSAFAFRKLEVVDDLFFNFTKQTFLNMPTNFQPEELAALAISMVYVKKADKHFFDKLWVNVKNHINSFTASDANHVIWSYAYAFVRIKNGDENPLRYTLKKYDGSISSLRDVIFKGMESLDGEQSVRVAWSFKNLRYRDDLLFNKLCVHIDQKIDAFTIPELINVTRTFASVKGIDEAVLQKLTNSIEGKIKDIAISSPQGLPSLAHGMLIKYCEKNGNDQARFIKIILVEIFKIEPSRWEAVDLSKIWAIYKIYVLKSKENVLIPKPLAKLIDDFLTHLKNEDKSSQLHLDVVNWLKKIEPRFQMEYRFEMYFLDIAYPEKKIAIEVDGPAHFDQYGNYLPKERVKEMMLELMGWRLIRISYHDWRSFLGSEKEKYLKQLLTAR